MPRCLDCGNTFKFYISSRTTDMVYYSEGGDCFDSDTEFSETDPDIPPKCGECESPNLEGDL